MRNIRTFLASQLAAEALVTATIQSPKIDLDTKAELPKLSIDIETELFDTTAPAPAQTNASSEEEKVVSVVVTEEASGEVCLAFEKEKRVRIVTGDPSVGALVGMTAQMPSALEMRYREGPPAVAYEPGKRTRNRGSKPSPAQRLMLQQQERRKKK